MAARPMKHGLYMDRPDNYVGRPVNLTGPLIGRPMCCPVLKGACAYADVIFNVNSWFFVSVGQLLSAHERHNNHYPLLTQSCFTNDSVG